MEKASAFLRVAATALETAADPAADALDALAAAFQLLSTDWEPIGMGPYRFVSEDADGVHLEAWPGYHGGLAATRYVDFVPARSDGSDLVAGTVDILQWPGVDTAYRATATARGVRFATLISGGFLGLQINARPGRLFADVNLRRALQLCIDLPRDVDAATGGVSAPVYGPVLPGSWADDPDLPKPNRDTAAAKRLIEGSGWQLGTDGIYAKDGVRLAAEIPVREGMTDRGMMADLVASQARECGMDLRSRPMSFDEMLEMLNRYPHILPGTTTPFELYLGAWSTAIDPDDGLSIFVSSAISDAEHPDNVNFGGFSDPAFDALVAAGRATYDQAERTRIYREAQQVLAAQVPYIFFWGFVLPDVVRSAVATVDGPLDLSVPNWSWQPERWVVAAP
jgi:peptide/nickel transport system substrate-binding protein